MSNLNQDHDYLEMFFIQDYCPDYIEELLENVCECHFFNTGRKDILLCLMCLGCPLWS